MICLLHGYLLEGSGSNLWTRAVVEALCRRGQSVHLVCQENHPELYDFIAEAKVYEPDGSVAVLFERETPHPGRCVLHKPRLGDTLPVYVADRYEEFAQAVPMVDLPDAAIEAYLARNLEVVERVIRENDVKVVHANHAVLMSVVAERAKARTGVPFAVMPHGSAIEYAVKRDPRFHALAESAFGAAGRVFVMGREMRARVRDTFADLPGLAAKIEDLPLGVDTAAFRPAARNERPERIGQLRAALAGLDRGNPAQADARLSERLRGDMTPDAFAESLAAFRNYPEKRPDAALEDKLAPVDWQDDELILFVGRLIAAKGLQSVVAALPLILEARPNARLIVVGHGPLREVVEAFLWALRQGEADLVRHIAAWGSLLEGDAGRPFDDVMLFFDGLAQASELDAYLDSARRLLDCDRVIFTGYLTHRELVHLFPCCDVAVFPSVVAEAGPLVFLEALAAGCFPLGTYFAGMAASIDEAATDLPPAAAEIMKLTTEPARKVGEIAAKTAQALALGGAHKAALRRAVESRHDWTTVADKLARSLLDLATA